ncbi:NAD(P)H-binding protein [Streptomyces cinnamoneus]|uniref:Nucleotide-diphosphate-sugar epimerase n=1 Tax=Streptomyces cinnamoneus TaxID=53446 RepID=A0A918TBS4_STRCJ|nr:NAD(P)H-binding protein [Streptomyces cinnamoneus]GHC38888.1 nucleotide-diphosphate-sugar epimerase [Streptomyces cinnamoneus]
MIVVTGATGNIGRSLTRQLLAEGASVRALSRNPESAGLPAEAEVVQADLTGSGSFDRALRGAEALYLNLAAGGGGAVGQVIDAAVEAGVRRIVLNSSLSVTGTPADDENFIARMHVAAEQAVRASGLEWTFVRGGMYATNALDWAEGIRAAGVVRGPYPEAAAAPVHEDDLAAVATRALLDGSGDLVGKAPYVTGPQAVTLAGQVAAIGRAIGREVRFERVSPETAAEELVARGLPKEAAFQLIGYFGSSVGTDPLITDEVQRITGRPARTFEEWARDHAHDFR